MIFSVQRTFLQWFGSERAKNLGLVRKSRFQISLNFAEKPCVVEKICRIQFCLFWTKDRNDVKFLSLRQTVHELWPKTSENVVFCAVAPPMSRLGWDFDRFSPNWALRSDRVSSLEVLRFGLHDSFYGGIIIIIKILTDTIGFQHFVLEPLIKHLLVDSVAWSCFCLHAKTTPPLQWLKHCSLRQKCPQTSLSSSKCYLCHTEHIVQQILSVKSVFLSFS